MPMTTESYDLRKVGLKVTHPRTRILQLLEQRTPHHHMTAEDIYRVLLDDGEEEFVRPEPEDRDGLLRALGGAL